MDLLLSKTSLKSYSRGTKHEEENSWTEIGKQIVHQLKRRKTFIGEFNLIDFL